MHLVTREVASGVGVKRREKRLYMRREGKGTMRVIAHCDKRRQVASGVVGVEERRIGETRREEVIREEVIREEKGQ